MSVPKNEYRATPVDIGDERTNTTEAYVIRRKRLSGVSPNKPTESGKYDIIYIMAHSNCKLFLWRMAKLVHVNAINIYYFVTIPSHSSS